MNRLNQLLAFLLALVLSVALPTWVHSEPVILQPGPESGKDIWTTSVFSYAPGGGGPGGGLNNFELVVGGFGDLYHSLIEFNLQGLPSQASAATLELFAFPGRGVGTTGLYVDRITSAWDWRTQGTGSDRERLWWADRPTADQWEPAALPAPVENQRYSVDITGLYNAWQQGVYPNYGIQLRPVLNQNNWSEFYSSDYLDDPLLRPRLVVESLTGPPLPQDGFLTAFNTAQNSLTQFSPGATLEPGKLISDRLLVQDVISKREQIELEYEQEVRAINYNSLLEVGEATLTAGTCLATGAVGCLVAFGNYMAGELLEEGTRKLVCESGDIDCEFAVNSVFFVINPTFEAYSFGVSAIVKPDALPLLGALSIGDEIGIDVPLFGSAHTLNLVRIAGIEGDRVDFHIDGVRQLDSAAVPIPATLILVVAGALIAAVKCRRR
jgi:hypothetical protein